MSILTSFSKQAPNRVFFAIGLGMLSGVCFSFLIPLLMSGIQPANPDFTQVDDAVTRFAGLEIVNFKMAMVYFTACLLVMSMRSLSEIILIRVGSELARSMRERFYKRISNASLIALEKVGNAKLIASINIDIPRIIAGGRILPTILVNLVTLTGMLGFLSYLNHDVFKMVCIAIVIGILLYQIPMAFGRFLFSKSRDFHDKLQNGINDLIYGCKELKLDVHKKNMFISELLQKNEQRILDSEKQAYTITRLTMGFGDLIAFYVIGIVCFVFVNYYSISASELVGVVMALLYVTGPIAVLLNTIPIITLAGVSHRKVNALFDAIPDEDVTKSLVDTAPWDTLTLKDVEFQYPAEDDARSFVVGPLNLSIKKGEISFIIGANGSGKSTLSKLLTLHFNRTAGDIYYGDTAISADNISSYRQKISAIYSNYHLFSHLLFEYTPEKQAMALKYLERFKLDQKVSIDDGKFSTTQLSDGQKKRLALLVAFLDEKEVYLFDEWAADQDPDFKHIYYTQILPELKARGKAIIVISHDDRYFDIADKFLVMEEGKLADANPFSKMALRAKMKDAADTILSSELI